MARILIIDDEPDLLAVMENFLEDAGHEVTVANDGREGFRLIEDDSYDLIVSDVVMPQKGGLELTMDLSVKHPSLRWILISGRVPITAPPVQSLINRFGITTILAKPFSRKQLVEAVASALDEDDGSS